MIIGKERFPSPTNETIHQVFSSNRFITRSNVPLRNPKIFTTFTKQKMEACSSEPQTEINPDDVLFTTPLLGIQAYRVLHPSTLDNAIPVCAFGLLLQNKRLEPLLHVHHAYLPWLSIKVCCRWRNGKSWLRSLTDFM